MTNLNSVLCQKIETAVLKYIQAYPTEYEAFKKQMEFKRTQNQNDWAALKGDHVLYRAMLETPETLWTLIKAILTPVEFIEFQEYEYKLWFGKKFPDFKAGRKL